MTPFTNTDLFRAGFLRMFLLGGKVGEVTGEDEMKRDFHRQSFV